MKKIKASKTVDEIEGILSAIDAGMSKHAVDDYSNHILQCFDMSGKYADQIINTGTDDEYFERTKPVAGVCKYARVIPIDFNDDGIAVAEDGSREAVIFEGAAGGTTVGYMDNDTMGMLTDPVIVGSKNTPLGVFIPFTASTQTLAWANQLFLNAAVNRYDATNPNRMKKLEISDF